MVEHFKYLLDSDIVITILRDRSDSTGLRRKALSIGLDNCYVSALTLAELYSGAYRMSSERGLHEVAFVKSIFNILPFGEGQSFAPEIFGKVKSVLCSGGTPLDDMDLLIGASALEAGYIVVTHNVRHFSRVPELRVEDWLQ